MKIAISANLVIPKKKLFVLFVKMEAKDILSINAKPVEFCVKIAIPSIIVIIVLRIQKIITLLLMEIAAVIAILITVNTVSNTLN